MSDAACSSVDAQRFAELVTRRLGLRVDDGQIERLAELLQQRVRGSGSIRPVDYLRSLDGPGSDQEWSLLAGKLSVGETYFYRCRDHFTAFAEAVLPALARARAQSRRLRILSVGCASGEEPYTLAMVLRQRPDFTDWQTTILGIDMSVAALHKARTGTYTKWSMREIPDEEQERWFGRSNGEFRIDPRLISMVRFEERNAALDDPDFWREGAYDVVFCRNLLIYLTQQAMTGLVERFARVLAPDGYLFLGHAESLRGVSHDFTLRNTHDCFYYQRRPITSLQAPSGGDPTWLSSPPWPSPSSMPPRAPTMSAGTDPVGVDWADSISRSSQRVGELAAPATASASSSARDQAAAIAALGSARDLFRQDRLDEAMQHLDAASDGTLGGDVDALLLRAAMLVYKGAIPEAEAMCRRIHAADDLNAGAHFIDALCAQQRGDADGSVRHARASAYLDAGFAMPHLHLGVIARRQGDRALAIRELNEALALLPREDSARILLFGGGFNRDMLSEMCRNELSALGTVP